MVDLQSAPFDNRGMLRTRGYALKGKRLVFRGKYIRKPRVSYLAFLAEDGVVDYFEVEGTFTRKVFTECLVSLVKKNKQIQQYPGKASIWILDGAKIHCDPNLIHMLRAYGIIPIFLPAYCPFFNPIELLFAMVKMEFQRKYKEGMRFHLSIFVSTILQQYLQYDFRSTFRKCGYTMANAFDPSAVSASMVDELEFTSNEDQ